MKYNIYYVMWYLILFNRCSLDMLFYNYVCVQFIILYEYNMQKDKIWFKLILLINYPVVVYFNVLQLL